MNAIFWQRMHGGSTHLPIVLLLASVLFDYCAWRSRDEGLRRGLHVAGLASAIVGILGGIGALISGLVMTRGETVGIGLEKMHHLFVWPAFGLCAALVGWRLFKRGHIPQSGCWIYLAGMGVGSALMMGAGYWGGEMLLDGGSTPAGGVVSRASDGLNQLDLSAKGRQLFLMNCAHCHAQDATGEEGPNLHGVSKSDARIASIIKQGIPGKMPKFGAKLTDPDVQSITVYIRSLH